MKLNQLTDQLTDQLTEAKNLSHVTFYHGSRKKFSKFDMRTAEEGHAEAGAGIYFTTSKDEAIGYAEGGYLYTVSIHFRKMVNTKANSKPKRKEIEKLLGWADDLEDTLANWGSLDNAVDSMVQYSKSEQDAFDQVWYDFYRGNVDKYLEGMVKLGYDGFYVDKNYKGIYHAVVFNPKSIQDIEVSKV